MAIEDKVNKTYTPIDLLLAISESAFTARDLKSGLDAISRLLCGFLPPGFLFLHLIEKNNVPQIIHAKALSGAQLEDKFIASLDTHVETILKTGNAFTTTIAHPGENHEDCYIGVPLSTGGTLLGVLSILIKRNGDVSEQESLVKFIANHIILLITQEKTNGQDRSQKKQEKENIFQQNLISSLSHDLRNPLGTIKGYTTTLLRSDINLNDEQRTRFLLTIDQETDRLIEMIDNFLFSAQFQTGQVSMDLQPVRINVILKQIADLHEATESAHLILENATSEVVILGDKRFLTLLFKNLISNAMKYAPNSRIWFKIIEDNDRIQVVMKDEGQGIPEQYLPHIFDRFFRAPDLNPGLHGSGLGLFVCKEIIKYHDGEILVDSKIGEGTTFMISFPKLPGFGNNSLEGVR